MKMIRLLLALCCAMMTLAVGHAARADVLPPVGEQHLAMRLVAESSRPRAGSSVTLALDTRPQPGWHGYWQNPGDAGFPATLAWSLAQGRDRQCARVSGADDAADRRADELCL